MPDTGDSRIGKILNRFYKKGLGGRDNWESIISMRSRGVIRLDSGVEMDIEVYQRKPDQLKLALLNEERSLAVSMAYDGEVAWKQVNGAAKPEPMDPEEARRFIHSSILATISSSLLPKARKSSIWRRFRSRRRFVTRFGCTSIRVIKLIIILMSATTMNCRGGKPGSVYR